MKRVLKEKGLDKKFRLYAHILQGFDLDPQNKNKSKNKYKIEVFLDSNSITNKKGIEENTKVIPSENSEAQIGDYPFYNVLAKIDTDLDLKLDFAPDVVVRLKNQEEEIGSFTVPVRTIRKKGENDYPHYFNFIKNNVIVGRLLAMFYITPAPPKINLEKEEAIFKLKRKLEVRKKASIKIFIHGIRDMDFKANFKKCKLAVKVLSTCKDGEKANNNTLNYALGGSNQANANQNNNNSDNNNNNLNKDPSYDETNEKILEELNEDDNFNYLNICQVFEFTTFVYGDPKGQDTNDDDEANLTIFPMIEFKLINSGFFTDTERFLIMNLSEFFPGFSEKTKLKYRKIFEDNLGTKTIDQEQRPINIKAATSGTKKNEPEPEKKELDEEEMNEEERLLFGDKMINFKDKKEDKKKEESANVVKPVTQKEINDFILKYENFDYHKFLDIIQEDCLCLKEDKDKERAAKRKLVKEKKQRLDELRRMDNVIK